MNQDVFAAQMRAYARQVEDALDVLVPQEAEEEGVLYDAMRHSLLAGGKRVRPVLVLAFCTLCGGRESAALPFACAVEMVHTYSLIHDDLPCMDDDALRRGRPTCHKVFGEATALLAGDALLTQAFEVMLSPEAVAGVGAARAVAAAQELACAAGSHGMVAGQVLDLAGEGHALNADALAELDGKKTGALICAAARMGCYAAGAGAAAREAATEYAQALGLAFQIQDDLLNVEGDAASMGKQTGTDAARSKSTYVSLWGLDKARDTVLQLTRDAVEALAPFGGRAEFLIALAESLAHREN